MPASPPRKPALKADHRRALALLAGSRDGCTEALFLAHGFTAKLIEAPGAAGHVTVATTHMRWAARYSPAIQPGRRRWRTGSRRAPTS
jgi:hypothetical protein